MKRGPWRGICTHQRRWRLNPFEPPPNALLTPFLLVLLLLLFVGLASTLPPLPPASPPGIFTSVAYSTLIREIQAGQILAVHLEGEALNGLRVREATTVALPRLATDTKGGQVSFDLEVANFLACPPEVTPACFDDNEEPRLSRARLIYTLVPEQEQPRLVTLLLKQRVVVSIVCPYIPPPWVPLIWKVGPLWLLFLLILGTDWPPSSRRLRW